MSPRAEVSVVRKEKTEKQAIKRENSDLKSKKLIRNYNDYETISNYCKPCNNTIFSYMYK